MALKIWDGYDHYSALSDLLARSGWLQWQVYSLTTPTITFQTGLTGSGKCMQVIGGLQQSAGVYPIGIVGVFADRNSEFFVGQRIKMPFTSGTLPGIWISLIDTLSNQEQFSIHLNEGNYSVQAYRGGPKVGLTSLGGSANNVWINNASMFVEVGAKIDASTGYITVKIDGATVINLTSINTKQTSNSTADAIAYNPSPIVGVFDGRNFTVQIDDFYYCDTTSGAGTVAANTFIGDARVATMFVNGNGTVQWTPFANTNWQEVAEQAMDSDGSYNSSSTATQEDQLTVTPLTGVVSMIYGVQTTIAARKDDAGSRTLKAGIKSGATVSYGSTNSLPNNYAYFTDQWILDPNTSANWTLTNLNNISVLYNLVS